MFKGFRIVDLSPELVPGKEDRRMAIREYVYKADNTYMHDIDMMSHVGVHIEAPSHYKKELTDVSRLPLKDFIGEALCLNVKSVGRGKLILPQHIKKISRTPLKRNDILILHSPYKGKAAPIISGRLAKWMARLPIKLLGIDASVALEEPGKMFSHDFLMRNDIAIIERLANLDKVPQRFLFIGFPLRIRGLDSSPIRAVALVKR
jgi:kynurenine formamidase